MGRSQAEVIRRFVAGPINSGKFEELEELFAPGVVFHSVYCEQPFLGPKGVAEFFGILRTGWPDIHVTIEDLLVEGDRAAARVTVRGTNTGPIRQYKPTGKIARFGEMFFFRFENGRIVELWQQVNVLNMLRQVGRAPTEEEMRRLQKILPVLKALGKVIGAFGKRSQPPPEAAPQSAR